MFEWNFTFISPIRFDLIWFQQQKNSNNITKLDWAWQRHELKPLPQSQTFQKSLCHALKDIIVNKRQFLSGHNTDYGE